ncbi:MAG: Ig-like domain-containing protein [Carboxydocellales bacterium]
MRVAVMFTDTVPVYAEHTPQTTGITSLFKDVTTKDSNLGGSPAILVPKFYPDNATNQGVTWSSSNRGVATMSAGGVVTPIAPGTATITVTSEDGGFTTTCYVSVFIPM